MAKNDVILLDGIIDERLSQGLPSKDKSEVFEFFVLEEMLKDYDFSREEIESGWIDGRNDGGFDACYITVNGHLVDDVNDFVWPRSNAQVELWLFTCKHHSTFAQATLDAILATTQELFDLGLEESELRGSYSPELIGFRALFIAAYRRVSIGRPTLLFNVVYASRGDSTQVGESVLARARQVEATFHTLFSSCTAQCSFVGASELVDLHRKAKTFALSLPFVEHLATGRDSYVLLVKLRDYWRFVADESGNLRRYLFDSNVRDFLGLKQVNEDIAKSLRDELAPDFWWLNNGVTILATNATVPGKTIQLQDIQIINGLQTTETIYRHFSSGSTASEERALLVKIIVSVDAEDRDRIIRATNNQTPVEIASLHATDRIQRDIDDILERNDWYYERRKNYYRNIGKPANRFVTPIYLASAVVSLLFKNPMGATRLKPKFMRHQSSYEAVFSTKFPIDVWPLLVQVYKQVDIGLAQIASEDRHGERFTNSWRPFVSLLTVARKLGTFSYTANQLTSEDKLLITEQDVKDAWAVISEQMKMYHGSSRRTPFIRKCCDAWATAHSLSGVEAVGRQNVQGAASKKSDKRLLTTDLVDLIDTLLPPQPWKAGVHKELGRKLRVSPNEVYEAINTLVASGRRYKQLDGRVFDSEGNVIAVDAERDHVRIAPDLLRE